MYMLATLPKYLSESQQTKRLNGLLTTFEFLQAKIDHLNIQRLIEDYQYTTEEDLSLIEHALRLSRFALSLDKTQLIGQLYGRLAFQGKHPRIVSLLKNMGHFRKYCSILPISESLVAAGTSLLNVLEPGALRSILYLCFLDGNTQVLGAVDATIRVWDITTGLEITRFFTNGGDISFTLLTHDGQHVICMTNEEVIIFNIKSHKKVLELPLHGRSVIGGGVISHDNHYFYVCTPDGYLVQIDLQTMSQVRTFQIGGAVSVISTMVNTSETIIIGRRNGQIDYYDTVTGSIQYTLDDRPNVINALVYLPDKNLLISASSTSTTLNIWDVKTGIKKGQLNGHTNAVTLMKYIPELEVLISGSYDYTLRSWDMKKYAPIATMVGHQHWVTEISGIPHSNLVASTSNDGTIRLWHIHTGQEVALLSDNSGLPFTAFGISSDGELAISGQGDGSIKLWRLRDIANLPPKHGHRQIIKGILLHNAEAISISSDRIFMIWDVSTGRLLNTSPEYNSGIAAIVPTVNASQIVLGFDDGSVKVVEVRDGRIVEELFRYQEPVTGLAFLSKQKLLASATRSGLVTLYDIQSKQVLRHYQFQAGHNRLWFISDHRFLMMKNIGGDVIEVWDISGQEPNLYWKIEKTKAVATIGITSSIIIAMADGTIRLCTIDNDLSVDFKGTHLEVYDITTSPNGRWAVSVAYDYSLVLWDLAHMQIAARFHADDALIVCAISEDGQYIVAGSLGGSVHVFQVLAEPGLLSRPQIL